VRRAQIRCNKNPKRLGSWISEGHALTVLSRDCGIATLCRRGDRGLFIWRGGQLLKALSCSMCGSKKVVRSPSGQHLVCLACQCVTVVETSVARRKRVSVGRTKRSSQDGGGTTPPGMEQGEGAGG